MTTREYGLIGVTAVAGVVVAAMFLDINPKKLLNFDLGFGKKPAARTPDQMVDLATKMLDSRVSADRRKAAAYFLDNPPSNEKPIDPERQKAVASRLAKARTDEDRAVRDKALSAFPLWAGPSETAELITMATSEKETDAARAAGLAALAKFNPPEAAAPLAGVLARGQATPTVLQILKEIGPPAEPHVLPLIFEPVPPGKLTPEEQEKTIRAQARKLLELYGTDKEKWLKQAVETVKAADGKFAEQEEKDAALARRLAALDWLADQPPNPAHPEVNAIFLRALRDKDEKVRLFAFQGIFKWLQPTDYNGLRDLLNVSEDTLRHRIIEMIGRLKVEGSETDLFRSLSKPKDRAVASKMLEGYGSKIEPMLVSRFLELAELGNPAYDAELVEVCRLLGAVGEGKKSLDHLESFAKIHTVKAVQSACADAATKIRKRTKPPA